MNSHSICLAVCQQELKQKVKNKSVWIMFALLQLLLAISLATSWQQFKQSHTTQETSQAIVEQQWVAQPDRHPHRVAHFGHFAFREPSVLSYFDIGINNWVGHSVFLEAHKQNSANFANDDNTSELLRFSELSVANILLVIWPMLLITMAFATISGEKEQGTLKKILAMGVSFPKILTGKIFAYLIISVSFILPIFIATALLGSFFQLSFTSDTAMRIGLLFALYLAYCLFWIVIILCCSSLSASSKVSLSTLITFWFIGIILAPRVLTDVAQSMHPTQTRYAFINAVKTDVKKVGNGHNPQDPYFKAFKEKVLAKYNVKNVADLPVNYRGLVMKEGERVTAEIYQRHYKKQLDAFQAQQDFLRNFYWFTPLLATQHISMALTASNNKHFFDFEMQAEQHRYDRIQQLNNIHIEEINFAHDRDEKASAELWKTFPSFHYQQPSLKQSLEPYLSSAAIFTFTLTALIFGLFSSFLKRRVYVSA
ncbi:DUF3526 domain-containing protein [Psychrobium sp. 1_MG-2023]|uniref:ABC transporter permease n=1 Tax=Psychrobium sp. 1_MG-2023 TaxID=3062624 RepID=UPI0026B3DB7A|nr:DUF3526 domain-containing protein [Psychrobium sp. 1_MG-2023]MDP2561837.1 DUF3526 domain-containing protein [Psychrobium sp. 1_MG-2023]